MTTATGRVFATMPSEFGEMEAGVISAPVTATRRHLLQNRRLPGGTVPYSWRAAPNPDMAGYVFAQVSEGIEYVRRRLNGSGRAALYSVAQWLTEVGAPGPPSLDARRPAGPTPPWSGSSGIRCCRGWPRSTPATAPRRAATTSCATPTTSPSSPEVAIISAADRGRWSTQWIPMPPMCPRTSAVRSGLVWCG